MSQPPNGDDDRERLSDEADAHFEQLLRCVIAASHKCAKADQVARALLFLLMRVANSWLSIRTLRKHSPHEEVFAVDAGTLLRAMFDAYLQAEYVICDKTKAAERASDYLEFEHVERYKTRSRVLQYDNWLTRRLKSSPLAADGEDGARQEYDRVRGRFPGNNGKCVRNRWYPGQLADIARTPLQKQDEYDTLLASFHGCVHSSAAVLHHGGLLWISDENVMDWASTVAARVARLNVDHNQISLSALHAAILAEWNKPYLGPEMS